MKSSKPFWCCTGHAICWCANAPCWSTPYGLILPNSVSSRRKGAARSRISSPASTTLKYQSWPALLSGRLLIRSINATNVLMRWNDESWLGINRTKPAAISPPSPASARSQPQRLPPRSQSIGFQERPPIGGMAGAGPTAKFEWRQGPMERHHKGGQHLYPPSAGDRGDRRHPLCPEQGSRHGGMVEKATRPQIPSSGLGRLGQQDGAHCL